MNYVHRFHMRKIEESKFVPHWSLLTSATKEKRFVELRTRWQLVKIGHKKSDGVLGVYGEYPPGVFLPEHHPIPEYDILPHSSDAVFWNLKPSRCYN